MKNLNKLNLIAPEPTLIELTNAINRTFFMNSIDQCANDLGRPIDIQAIQLSAVLMGRPSSLVDQFIMVDLAIGTTNEWNPKTNLFNFLLQFNTNAFSGNPISEPTKNLVLGDFQSSLFTLKPFTTDLSGGLASVGQLFLNAKIQQIESAAASTLILNCYITLYYK